MQLTL